MPQNSGTTVRFMSVTPLTLEEENTFFEGKGFGTGARRYLGRKLRQMYESSMDTALPKAIGELMMQLNHYDGLPLHPQAMPELVPVRVKR